MSAGWRSRYLPSRPGPVLLSGALLGLAHPPFHLLVPSFVALVPFAVWLEGLPPGREGRSEARRGGFFLGLVYYSLVFYWLLVALVYYTPLAVLGFLAPVLILSGFLALATLGMRVTRVRLGWPVWLALPVFWVAIEWLRANIPQVGFPWMQLGDTLTGFPRLIGTADLVGSRGLSFWLALVNGLVAALFVAWRSRRGEARKADATVRLEGPEAGRAPPWRLAAGLLLVLALPIGYSLARWEGLELRPAARVGIVQPNVPEHLKIGDRDVATDSALASTETLVRPWVEQGEELDLVILPETVFPAWPGVEPLPSVGWRGRPDLDRWTGALATRLDAAVLYGGLGATEREGTGREYDYFNSAFLVTPDGVRAARYDKRFLVPMVERVPFVDPRWFAGLRYFGGFGVGPWAPPLPVDDARFGVLICYESIFTQLSRHYRRLGADFLVNVTNDAWFGREVWWSRSSALWQHPAHLVMRAVETRMGVARSANTGISEIVDPLGRVSHATALFEPAAFAGTVMTTDARTVYVRYGDTVGWAAVLAAILGLLVAILGARTESKRSG